MKVDHALLDRLGGDLLRAALLRQPTSRTWCEVVVRTDTDRGGDIALWRQHVREAFGLPHDLGDEREEFYGVELRLLHCPEGSERR